MSAQKPASPSDEEVSRPGAIVLLVEDEVLVRMEIADHLRRVEYHVIEVGSADAAIDALERETRIDIVFSD
jgi:two-component system, response regulator PdtaR